MALLSFLFPVARFLLLGSLDHNTLAAYEAWKHEESQSRKEALRGINSFNPVTQVQRLYKGSCSQASLFFDPVLGILKIVGL